MSGGVTREIIGDIETAARLRAFLETRTRCHLCDAEADLRKRGFVRFACDATYTVTSDEIKATEGCRAVCSLAAGLWTIQARGSAT